MDTIRINIAYRPLRIGWVIRSGDISAFRRVVRLSYGLWGGRFNPILVADHAEHARSLVDVFRVDMLWAIDDTGTSREFRKAFPHLITPFFPRGDLFVGGARDRKRCQVLDVSNAFAHLIDRPEWKSLKDKGVRVYNWAPEDPLADVFLVHLGAYLSVEETGSDYRAMLIRAADATEHSLNSDPLIPADALEHRSIASISGYGLEQHYATRAERDIPGFFVGDATNVDDLVDHWNLRAANIPLWFVDRSHFARYSEIVPAWEQLMRAAVSRRHEWDRHVGVWARREGLDEAAKLFGDLKLLRCPISEHTWNGLKVPMMYLGETSVLGVVGRERGKARVSFALSEKPFADDIWFHTQQLVASISFIGGLFGDEQHTLEPPYLPELNEFYARTMHFEYSKLRVEPRRIGLVIDAVDHDAFVYALPVSELMERIFGLANYTASWSSSGLIVRQLISRLGGLRGASVFKVPGVRRLLRTYALTDAFTKKSALGLIGSTDPDNPDAQFSDHEGLYIEPRPVGTKLRPDAVFEYLVEKGIFRIGAELTCPSCRMRSWTPLDALRQRLVCELCGHEYDATRQLVSGHWHYRRSGVFGTERNAQGAVPVALTLQQLEANLHDGFSSDMYSPSLDLKASPGGNLPNCEVDFVWLIPHRYSGKTGIILGECKDRGPLKPDEFARDVENLRRVADALPDRRFETFVLLSKLAPFTQQEIEIAKGLNGPYQLRVILLTARELEPWFIFDRTKTDVDVSGLRGTPEGLAEATFEMYFKGKDGTA